MYTPQEWLSESLRFWQTTLSRYRFEYGRDLDDSLVQHALRRCREVRTVLTALKQEPRRAAGFR